MPHKRLDSDARAIINLANEIAHEFELDYVGTEHILLAILRHADSPAAKALHNLGVDELTLRTRVEELDRRAKEDTWVLGRLPGSPGYHNVIERAMEVAEQLEAREIGGEHLLLALFQDKNTAAQQALASMGITVRKCRDEVLRVLNEG